MKKITALLILSSFMLQAKTQYTSVFWKISGNGLDKPSYLFGTMHTGDERVFENVKKSLPYLDSCKAYAMELDPDKLFDVGLLDKITMGKDYSLKKMIPTGDYALLDSMITKAAGIPLAMMDNMQPMFVATILESMEMGLSDTGDDEQQVMDIYFFNLAKDKGKKVIGIETVEEQLTALNSLSYQEQADMLDDEIKSMKTKGKDEGKDVLKFYMQQNLDSLADSESDMSPKFYKALVTDRNARMADRIAKFIKEQPTFIAIGAMHLPFKEGVIELLRAKGFAVEPVRGI